MSGLYCTYLVAQEDLSVYLSFGSIFSPALLFDLPYKGEKDVTLYSIGYCSCWGIIMVRFDFETGFRSAAVLEIIHCCVVSLPFSIVWSRELREPRTVLHPAQSTEQGGLSQQPRVI